MNKEELYARAKTSIIEGDQDDALKVIEEAKIHEMDLLDLLCDGFGPGNVEIGDQFDRGDASLPELIISSELMRDITEIICNALGSHVMEKNGKVLIATVKGDIHEIGKGIVASTVKAAGFEVIDMGCDITYEEILKCAEENNVDIIATSALLTSTLIEQKNLEKYLRDKGVRDKYITMVGGAPCTRRWAKRIGADGYGENAIDTVRVALELMEKSKK